MNNLTVKQLNSERTSIGPLLLNNRTYIHCQKSNSNDSLDSRELSYGPGSERTNKQAFATRQSRIQSIYSFFNNSRRNASRSQDSKRLIISDVRSTPNFLKIMKSKAIVNKFIANLFRNTYILPRLQKHLLHEEYISQNYSLNNSANFEETRPWIEIFQPGNHLLFCWDLIGITVNLISLWLSPFQAAFSTQIHVSIQIIIIWYLFLDILVNMNRSAISFGDLINTRALIIKHYFKGQAIYDIVSLSIWIYIFNAPEQQILLEMLQIIQIFVTIQKIIFNFDKFFESLYSKGIFSNLIDLLTLVISVYFFAHLMACIWYYIGKRSQDLLGNSWLQKYNIENDSNLIKYNYSIYWATTTIVTVGYGDISPQNQIEIIFTTIMMFISSCVYGYSLNSIGIILKNIQDSKQQYKKMLLRINDYMNHNKVQFELQLRVRNFLKFHLFENEQQESVDEIKNIMQKLPENLRDSVNKNIQLKILDQITLLKDLFSSQTVTEMSKILETTFLSPNDVLYQQNERSDPYLYFVYSGQIQLYDENSRKILGHVNSGQKFSEYQFFTGFYPKCSAKSTQSTVLYKISREKFLQIIQYNEKDFQRFHNIKDQILLYKDYSKCFSQCNICGKYSHEVIECPCLTYQPNLEQRLKKENFNQPLNMRAKANRTTSKIHCLFIYNKIETSIRSYQEQNNISIVQLSDFQYGKVFKSTIEGMDKKSTFVEPRSKKAINADNKSDHELTIRQQQIRKQTYCPSIIAGTPHQKSKQRLSIFQCELKSQNNMMINSIHSQQTPKMLSDIQIQYLESSFHLDQIMEFKEYMPQNNVNQVIKQIEKGGKKAHRNLLRQMKELEKITFLYYVKIMTVKIRRNLLKNQGQPFTESQQVQVENHL